MLVVRESRTRPAGTLLKCTKCLLLHLLTFVFFVLLVTRPSHRQAAWAVLCVCVCEGLCLIASVFVRVCLSSNTHICILYMSEEKK